MKSQQVIQVKPEEMATELMEEFHFATLKDTRDILVWENGIYKEGGEVKIEEETARRLPSCSTGFVREVVNHITWTTFHFREEFDADPMILNLKNGLYDFRTGQLCEHSPSYLSRVQLPVFYQRRAAPKRFRRFLQETHPDKAQQRLLWEMIASCLDRTGRRRKAFMLVGPPNSGKSTYLNVLTALLGKANVSNLSLQLLTNGERFASAELEGKFANIYADISDNELKSTGSFKILTGGDRVTAQRKFKPLFQFTPFARFLFSANKLPRLRDGRDDAFFDRWIVMPWEEVFDGDRRNENLLAELTTPEELSGILNVVLGLARRIIERGRLSIEPAIEETRALWLSQGQDLEVFSFLNEFVVKDTSGYVRRQDLWAFWSAYRELKGWKAISQTKFNRSVEEFFGARMETLHPSGGKSTEVWKGITPREAS